MNHYIDVFCEQFDLLHLSGLYKSCNKLIIYISSYNKNLILDSKLKEYDPENKFLIFKSKKNLKEKFAINDFRNHIEDENYMFYFHSKGVSYKPDTKRPKRFSNMQNWRKILNLYTISKWRMNLKLLKKYDAVGCFLTRWPAHHFSGNFWWATIDYISDLPACEDHYLSPEMWLAPNFNNDFISLASYNKFNENFHLQRTDKDILKNISPSIINNEEFKEGKYYTRYYLNKKT